MDKEIVGQKSLNDPSDKEKKFKSYEFESGLSYEKT